MKTLRIPLVGSFVQRTSEGIGSLSTDQIFDNCFPVSEINPLTGKQSAFLTKRNGFNAVTLAVTTNALGSYGLTVWTGCNSSSPVIASYTKNASSVAFFVAPNVQVGSNISSSNACTYLDETVISGAAHLTASIKDTASSTLRLYYFPEGGAWAQVTSAALTTMICSEHAHMDGYWFAMRTDGRIYNSDLNTVSSWQASNFVSDNSFADKGVGIARYKNTIVAFGDYGLGFYFNAGNAAGSVLSRIKNADIRIGCVRRNNTIGRVFATVGDTIYWIGINPDTGRAGIYRLKGYTAEKISTTTIDRILSVLFDFYIAGAFQLMGMAHLMFGSTSSPTTSMLCYCIDQNFWWRFVPGNGIQVSAIVGGPGNAPTQSAFISPSTDVIYRFSALWPSFNWIDNATSTYTMRVQTDNMDVGTDRKKFWRKLRITYDRQGQTSPITVSASDDDFVSYSALGSIDTVSSNAQSWITRLGASRRRSWRFEHSTSTACRIAAIEIDYDMGDP